LRTVEKVYPPYPLNKFPKEFGYNLGKELIYLLATKGHPSLEGKEWEEIFAICINAKWTPSNVGLDDVVLGNCAWGAKTVKARKPSEIASVRLISGRNSPIYSYGETKITDVDPSSLGVQILSIWNERVSAIRRKFMHARNVVLIKSETLDEVAVFEFETIRYDPELFNWAWNRNNNLEGYDGAGAHRFTWQPHGSQFTIVEKVPYERLIVRINIPHTIEKDAFLQRIGFDKDWITIINRNDR